MLFRSHRKGSDTLLKTIKYANELGIKYLTVFAFSTENWNRPKKEVDYLMNLALKMFDKNQKEFKKTNIKTNVIGDLKRLPVSLQEKINEGILRSKDRNGLIFTVALSYGSREEIVSSAKRLALDVLNEKININDINEEVFSSYLYTCNLPEIGRAHV